MGLTRNSFHQSTRVTSDSLVGGAPPTYRETNAYLPQLQTVPPADTSISHERRSHRDHQHHDSSGTDQTLSQTHPSMEYKSILPSASKTNRQYPGGEVSHNVLQHRQEGSTFQIPFQHRDNIHSHKSYSRQNIERRIHSFHRPDDHCHSMYPQKHIHHSYKGEPSSPWKEFRASPSPTNHSVVTNVDTSSLQGSSSGSIVDHTYRDFSGVPPSKEDLERYKNKKSEFKRRIKEKKDKSALESSLKKNSTAPNAKKSSTKKRGRGNKAGKGGNDSFVGFMGTNFPARLHDLLSHENNISDTITWLPHGRSWIVRDKKKFLESVAPSHFQISKFESFTRQVNGWGFKRITQGPDINSYYHELFLKGMPHLIQWMKRPPSSSGGPGKRKPRADPKDEPNFYEIGSMYPIPDYYGENKGIPISGSSGTAHEVRGHEESRPVHALNTTYSDDSLVNLFENKVPPFIDHNNHAPPYHYGSWDYPAGGHRGTYPPSPKRQRPNSPERHPAARYWSHEPYRTDHYPYDSYLQNPGNDHGDACHSRSDAKEASPRSKQKDTGLSKNHWQSFCEALSQSEDEENKQVSNNMDQNDVASRHIIESIDFEPHSFYDFTPVTDFRSKVYNRPYHQE